MQLSQPTGDAAPGATDTLDADHITRVLVLIPKHAVELADPRAQLDDAGARKADGKSAAASIEIHYVRAEAADPAGDPTVYSIRRAADLLLPVKDATVDVIIVLSEKPKEFKKGNVDVTNATHVDPVALERFLKMKMVLYPCRGQ